MEQPTSRALWGAVNLNLREQAFSGDYALFRAGETTLAACTFTGAYPLWHAGDVLLTDCRMADGCRDPLRGARRAVLRACRLTCDGALPDTDGCLLDGCVVIGDRAGWDSRRLTLRDTVLTGADICRAASDLTVSDAELTGDRPGHRLRGAQIDFSTLTGQDLLWGAEGVTVTDSVLSGDRIGWYSRGLKLVHCHISGADPFAFCTDLVLEDCVMETTGAAFEDSTVQATLRGAVSGVYNPRGGSVTAAAFPDAKFDAHRTPGTDCRLIPDDTPIR